METKIDMLQREIDKCLTEMETAYPELFRNLDETPVFGEERRGSITEAALKNYLQSLRSQMESYRQVHGEPLKD
ncbi:hypothetical protein [Flagellimonas beolgyonensis]|uniref:hypothetical protein n=1 Tax=Flagellimonas beolgyonensis TaxID=864064 RepID=UPI003D657D06